jgi:MFS family permease
MSGCPAKRKIENLPLRLPIFHGWIIVAVTFVTMGIGVNARTAFSLLFPPILNEFGWDRGATAGAFSFGFVVSALFTPTIGRMMDRFGPRSVMELGTALMAAGFLLAPFTTQPWHLYLTIGVLVGGGSVCLGYSGFSLFLPNWFIRRRGLAIGLAFSGVGFGSVTLLPWLQSLIVTAGWRHACLSLGLLILIVLVPINLLLRKRPEDMGLTPDGDAAPVAAGSRPQQNVVDQIWAAVDWTLARAVRTVRFWWLSLGYFGALYAWYAVQVHQTKYLQEVGFSPNRSAWALGLVSLIGVAGNIALGYLSDRIGREWVWSLSQIGFVICFLALIALGRDPSPLWLWLMVAAQGGLGYGLTSVMGAIVAEILHGRNFGAIFGTVMIAALAGGAAGPWVTGVLHDALGDYTLAFGLGAAISVISALAIWRASPRKIRAVAGRIGALTG